MKKGLEDWNTEEKLLLFKGQVYIPDNNELRAEIMKIHHDNPAAGHPGQHKTLGLVS